MGLPEQRRLGTKFPAAEAAGICGAGYWRKGCYPNVWAEWEQRPEGSDVGSGVKATP